MDSNEQHDAQDNEQQAKTKKMVASFVVILAVVIVAVGVAFFAKKDKASDTSATNTASTSSTDSTGNSANTTDSTTTPSTSTGSTSSAAYKDGSYSATGKYNSPGGTESITVNITVKDGNVTDSSVDQKAVSPTGEQYQEDFKNNYKTLVIGKALSSIKLTHVSGSSLTPQGFNAALETIKSQAAS